MEKSIVVLGCGVSGLSFAFRIIELGWKGRITIIEKEEKAGGLARSYEIEGNFFDIGPHNFRDKEKEGMYLWKKFTSFKKSERITRIYYKGKLFHYPLRPIEVFEKIGVIKSLKIILSYVKAQLTPIDESSFEGWVIKHFGEELYKMFFKGYTEKVVGVKAKEMGKDWIENRTRKMSIMTIIKYVLGIEKNNRSLYSFIKYPEKLSSGELYEKIAEYLKSKGVEIIFGEEIKEIKKEKNMLKSVITEKREVKGDLFISTIPIKDLAGMLGEENLEREAKFRNHISIGFLFENKINVKDHWIYLHDENFLISRLYFPQNFNKEHCKGENCVVVEVFCNYDKVWSMKEKELIERVEKELLSIDIFKENKIKTYKIVKNEKAYPLYMRDLKKINEMIKELEESYANLYLTGRGGKFKYIHMDEAAKDAFKLAEEIYNEYKDKV